MTTWEPGYDVDTGLAALRVHDADPERVERIRARCLWILAAQRRKGETPRARHAAWIPGRPKRPAGWLEPALALGLGALYLAEAVTRALAVCR